MRLLSPSIFIVFFVTMNISLYLINETAILPYEQSPYETPEGIKGRLMSIDLSLENLVLGATTLAVSGLIGIITGHLLFGGTIGIILFAIDLFLPVVKWIVFGIPSFMGQMGVPLVIITGTTAVMAAVWFWFLLGFVAQRPMED